MRIAAMPGKNQQLVARNHVAKNIGVRKNRTEHQGPGDDSRTIHWALCKHFVAAEHCLAYKRSGDSVSDGVHGGRVYKMQSGGEILVNQKQWRAFGNDAANVPRVDTVVLQ